MAYQPTGHGHPHDSKKENQAEISHC